MLRIFKGKQTEYNRLILKSLLSDSETTTQIAEYIYFHRKKIVLPTVLNKLELRKIVSVISRKRGGLDALKKWGYINRKKGEREKWELTDKGFPVALTCFDTIGEFTALQGKQLLKMMEETETKLKQFPYLAFMTEWLNVNDIDRVLGFLRDATLKIIREGVDLDKLSINDADALISAQLLMFMATTEFMKKKKAALEKTVGDSNS